MLTDKSHEDLLIQLEKKDKIIEDKQKEILVLKSRIFEQKDKISKMQEQAEFLMNESKQLMWNCRNVNSQFGDL